ncbi:sel1 repeat family protein [Pelomyxa schiedti]|nr:sel1 repeat family protein [Pelomyxa schiedti]
MVRLGWRYQHGVGVKCDPQRAVSLYNSAIHTQSEHSWRLGVCYLRGEGVEKDWAKAVTLIQQSGNSDEAQAHLGWCYLWGCGVAMDVAYAVKLLNRAAQCWCGRAMVFLGYCHQRGIGVVQDTDKAYELYSKAKGAAWGAEALGELGVYCQRGDCGAPTDKRAAVGYFLMGAEYGDPVSMFHLGMCLRDGDDWLKRAAQFGHSAANIFLSSSPSHNKKNNSAKQDILVKTLKAQVKSLKEQISEESTHSAEQVDSLKKQLADVQPTS